MLGLRAIGIKACGGGSSSRENAEISLVSTMTHDSYHRARVLNLVRIVKSFIRAVDPNEAAGREPW